MSDYPLPRTYRTALADDWVRSEARNPNFALVLQKIQPWRQRHNQWGLLGDSDSGKSNWLRSLENHAAFPDQALFKAVTSQWQERVSAFKATTVNLATASRLVVGFGSESTLENGIALHKPTGLPIIPGSALKGLCRAVCLASIATEFGIASVSPDTAYPELNAKPKQLVSPGWHTLAMVLQGLPKEQRKAFEIMREAGNVGTITSLAAFDVEKSVILFRQMFGDMSRAGALIFFDSFPIPTAAKLFEADVLTPHFGDYYTKGQAPNDDLKPSPNVFLTVPADITFAFGIGVSAGSELEHQKTALGWLQFALSEMGVGAKTSSGYGRFKKSPNP